MNYIKKSLVCAAAAGAATLATAAPEVGNVTFAQSDGSRQVTITYTLTKDAVVTLDVMTNATPNAATGWTSIGGEAVCNAQGAVWRKVTSADADGQGKYTITWRPDLSWADENGKGFKVANGCAKAVLTAWSLTNTPNYMVVDISSTATAATPRKYYPGADYLPGGILDNPDYRTTKLVMRKIMAKDVEWTMGSVAEENRSSSREATHSVKLTGNYYIGVFEFTQAQWALIQTARQRPSYCAYTGDRPVEQVCYNEIRRAANDTVVSGGTYPDAPYASSFLDLLNTKTGLDFDLPSESQWEFAARAGNGDGKWGDGSAISSETVALVGRYGKGASEGTASVGSYRPNSWGLYDMHGNVAEWCLDGFTENISSLNGAVNANDPWNRRIIRGGCWWDSGYSKLRSAYRDGADPAVRSNGNGFRVVCTAGLQ